MLIDKSITKALCNEAEIEEARHMEKVVWKKKSSLVFTNLKDERYFKLISTNTELNRNFYNIKEEVITEEFGIISSPISDKFGAEIGMPPPNEQLFFNITQFSERFLIAANGNEQAMWINKNGFDAMNLDITKKLRFFCDIDNLDESKIVLFNKSFYDLTGREVEDIQQYLGVELDI